MKQIKMAFIVTNPKILIVPINSIAVSVDFISLPDSFAYTKQDGNGLKRGKRIYQFQVGYMLNTEFIMNKVFKEQIESNLARSFSGATRMPVRKLLKKGNTCVLPLLMFS